MFHFAGERNFKLVRRADKVLKFSAEILLAALAALTGKTVPARWLVAFSGGIDSAVLLHALATSRTENSPTVIAVHVDHGIHKDSASWADHCRKFATTIDVELVCLRATVSASPENGPEAAARDARYAALREYVQDGDCLLSAHHEEDQAETLLLNLLRGSGLQGLAGIAKQQQFASGRLLRPLLDIPSRAIADYARHHNISWIEDPSNKDRRYDRNFLRHEVFPLLVSRWPAAARRIRASAELAGEAGQLLRELADVDLQSHPGAHRLSLPLLSELSRARQRNLLRQAIGICGLPPAPASCLYQVVNELVPARADAQPMVAWPGAEVRRYRDCLFLLPALDVMVWSCRNLVLAKDSVVELGAGMGSLQLVDESAPGIDPGIVSGDLRVRFRQGGEKFRPFGHDCTRKLKILLQNEGVLPWMRERLPLLYSGEKLVAVADMWIAADCVAQSGLVVRWQDRPLIR